MGLSTAYLLFDFHKDILKKLWAANKRGKGWAKEGFGDLQGWLKRSDFQPQPRCLVPAAWPGGQGGGQLRNEGFTGWGGGLLFSISSPGNERHKCSEAIRGDPFPPLGPPFILSEAQQLLERWASLRPEERGGAAACHFSQLCKNNLIKWTIYFIKSRDRQF